MTYAIIYDAVKIKTTHFEKAASIINMNEMAAAVIIGYRQAGLTPPDISTGLTAEELRNTFFRDIEGRNNVNPKLIAAIREYPQEKDVIDEAAKATYDFGLTLTEMN